MKQAVQLEGVELGGEGRRGGDVAEGDMGMKMMAVLKGVFLFLHKRHKDLNFDCSNLMDSVSDMATAASRRESRRKKIINRGADRLALITGRINSVPPESNNVDQSTGPPSITTASPTSEEDIDSSISGLKFDSFDGGNAPVTTRGAEIEAVRSTASDASDGVVSLANGISSNTASGTRQGLEQQTQTCRRNSFDPKRISVAVDASRTTRPLCSVVVAIFVVISHLGFPLLRGRLVKSIVNFRPLVLVLLTNLTVVATRVLLDGSGNNERSCKGQSNNGSKENAWPDQVGKSLEVGLATQKVINALVMDCSVYVVLLVCGLCFT